MAMTKTPCYIFKLASLDYFHRKSTNFHTKTKQVAQRATIAHLSPMCQGQIHLKKNNIEMDHENQRPEIELVRTFMPVLVTSNFDDDSIKNEWASMETPFSHYKSTGNFLDAQGQLRFSPPPVMLHIKFDQDWPTDLRDIQVRMSKIFVIQGQVTPKWVVWSGLKTNSCELLCLSWLPATLMMIRSKINQLAWRQHFPIISLGQLTG